MISSVPVEEPSSSKPLCCVFVGFAVLCWVAPFFGSGWTGSAWSILPKAVGFQHTVDETFTKRRSVWWDQHIEGRGMDNTIFAVPESAMFGMGALGFGTRLDRILIETNQSRVSGEVRLRLAEFLFGKLRSDPGLAGEHGVGKEDGRVEPPLKSLRIVRTLWKVGDEVLANPAGEWNPPPVTEVKGVNHQVLGTYQIVAGKVVEIWSSRTLETPQMTRGGTAPRVAIGIAPGATKAIAPRAASGTAPTVAGGARTVPQRRLLAVPTPSADGTTGVAAPRVISGRASAVRTPSARTAPKVSPTPVVRSPNGSRPPGIRLRFAVTPRPSLPPTAPEGTSPPAAPANPAR